MSNSLLVRGAGVVSTGCVLENTDVLVLDGVFHRLGKDLSKPPGLEEINATGLFLWPGLIDLHLHGARGLVAGQGREGVVEAVSSALASQGVTRFVLSLPSLPAEEMLAETARLSREISVKPSGAGVLGLHLEGPFLSPLRTGAMPRQNVRKPDLKEFDSLLEAAQGRVKMMTIAPETIGAFDVIRKGVEAGLVMAAGHSEASLSEMETAIQIGLRHITHCFNAMKRFSHRSPGPVEVALSDEKVSLELICDGTHLHPLTLKIVLKCRKPEAIVLVSDSTAFEATDGIISFMGKIFEVRSGVVRDTQTGALGGSASSLWRCVCNVKEWLGLERYELAWMASLNPARVLGVDSEFGSVEPGKRADFFLADADMAMKSVFLDGMPIWQA